MLTGCLWMPNLLPLWASVGHCWATTSSSCVLVASCLETVYSRSETKTNLRAVQLLDNKRSFLLLWSQLISDALPLYGMYRPSRRSEWSITGTADGGTRRRGRRKVLLSSSKDSSELVRGFLNSETSVPNPIPKPTIGRFTGVPLFQ